MSYETSLQAMRLRHLHSQPDEGYSEDVHSSSDSELGDARDNRPSDAAKITLRSIDTLSSDEKFDVLRLAASSFSPADQLALLKDILFQFPTWAKQEISSHLDSLMFFDPVQYFPYEIVQTIFSHLTPKDLLNASVVNHAWRIHTQDEELWRICFNREGWKVDSARLRAVENAARERAARHPGSLDSAAEHGLHRRDSRKRRRVETFSDPEPMLVDSVDHMDGVEGTPASAIAPAVLSAIPSPSASHTSPTATPKGIERRRYSTQSNLSVRSSHTSVLDASFKLKPTLMQTGMGSSDEPRVSWAYLYKQRRMLERNWETGTYQQFRLPHPKYEHEGHAECVYTIQRIGSTLVSGSRDRTIRRWDLETCRLKGQPLKGHAASVLCLQFDPTPENDLIVSGGSDSWVIFWRYSTGQIIKKMTTAHTEPVLNLRFDDRYVVTCSKDKTIKIWSRRAMKRDDPLLPAHILQQSVDANGDLLIEEYSLLTQLLGHHAAVNAVMIHGDRVVSASGDRHIKAWSIQSGRCERTYTGHTKGIACVQYDGRRIISGSSDNTVRIFDAEQQAEVACLQGHSDLVRTVQARFGDLEVTSDEELHEEAKQADMRWSRAIAMGASPASVSRRSLRNAGSSRPEDMLTIGAKVPPGGGGTRWARIVSGSYDETVIIWRKDHDGKWVAKHKLHQDMLFRSRWRSPRQVLPAAPPAPQPNAQAGLTQQNLEQHQHPLHPAHNTVPTNQLRHHHAPTHRTGTDLRALQSNAIYAPALDAAEAVQTTITAGPSTQTVTSAQQNDPQLHSHLQNHHRSHQQAHSNASAQADPQTQQAQQRPATQQAVAAATQAGHQVPGIHMHAHAARLDSNRIFKLQFDVRRIVCCSQNKIIVGWDFAAGNEELGKVGNWCEETY